jgi:hypothetical protein
LRFAPLPHPARPLAAYSNLAAPRKRGATQDIVRPARRLNVLRVARVLFGMERLDLEDVPVCRL